MGECPSTKSLKRIDEAGGYFAVNCEWRDKRPGNHKHSLRYTRIYVAYYEMLKRNYNKKSHAYCRYGGAGGKVCDRWLGREGLKNFVLDMSPHPGSGYSLDRIDNRNKTYSPENCRWADKITQARNKGPYCHGKSGYKGVSPSSRNKSRWRAKIGKTHLGYFDTEEDAARAYDMAALDRDGPSAYLNFPEK